MIIGGFGHYFDELFLKKVKFVIIRSSFMFIVTKLVGAAALVWLTPSNFLFLRNRVIICIIYHYARQ